MLIVVDDELTVIGVLGWMVVQQMFTCSHETANRSLVKVFCDFDSEFPMVICCLALVCVQDWRQDGFR